MSDKRHRDVPPTPGRLKSAYLRDPEPDEERYYERYLGLMEGRGPMQGAPPMAEADEVVEKYHDRILRYIFGFVRERAEAGGLTQETFLRAYSRGETLRDPKAVRGWL